MLDNMLEWIGEDKMSFVGKLNDLVDGKHVQQWKLRKIAVGMIHPFRRIAGFIQFRHIPYLLLCLLCRIISGVQ
jgi:hypothetical protein